MSKEKKAIILKNGFFSGVYYKSGEIYTVLNIHPSTARLVDKHNRIFMVTIKPTFYYGTPEAKILDENDPILKLKSNTLTIWL